MVPDPNLDPDPELYKFVGGSGSGINHSGSKRKDGTPRERKEESFRPKYWELNELPYTEMLKSIIIERWLRTHFTVVSATYGVLQFKTACIKSCL